MNTKVELILCWKTCEYSDIGVNYTALTKAQWDSWGKGEGGFNYLGEATVDEPNRDEVVSDLADAIDKQIGDMQHNIDLLLGKKQQLLAIEAK